VRIAHPTSADEAELLAMNRSSERFHRPWAHPPQEADGFRELLERDAREDCEVFLVRRESDDALVGVFVLSQIFRKAFQSAYLGYYGSREHGGNGYMREGLALVLDQSFGSLGLHRVEANIQPGNHASLALARAAGFRREGFSPRYLKIGGRWRDHERLAILAEDWLGSGGLAADVDDPQALERQQVVDMVDATRERHDVLGQPPGRDRPRFRSEFAAEPSDDAVDLAGEAEHDP